MRKIFLLPAVLLCTFVVVLLSCGTETTEESCETFGEDVGQGECVIPGDANICCDETSCTLTMEGYNYVCNNPEMTECINAWVDDICPTKNAADREIIAAMLRSMTTKLLNEARMNSVCK